MTLALISANSAWVVPVTMAFNLILAVAAITDHRLGEVDRG
ncbi:hypothetical protein [Rhodococcus sp. IEGM 1307]|nr:hypothetical protein [Rhodococcus sp. IEGM 1307]MDI9978842.1 hypothetical protein [Rhodococcus sp. IEGM 1307]